MLLHHAPTAQVPNDHQAGGDGDPHVQSGSCAIIELRRRLNQFQASAHRSLGIFLVCLRIAEIGEYAVAHISRDETPGFRDDLGATALIGADDLSQRS